MSDNAIYRVTAHALNLRSGPLKDSAKLGVMAAGALVTRVGNSPDPAWIQVSWNGMQGYASSLYLQLQSSMPPGSVPATHAPASAMPAPPVEQRDRDLTHLHPVVREAVTATLKTLNDENIPFQLFEGYRTPERQAFLYRQGRTRPGGKVTNADAWQSYHQYGLGCDLVLFEANGWSWDTAGAKAKWWDRMKAVAVAHGLRTLSFERPHVELDGPEWRDLQAGRKFPEGGDDTWLENLSGTALRWRLAHKTPSAPPIQYAERPPLEPA